MPLLRQLDRERCNTFGRTDRRKLRDGNTPIGNHDRGAAANFAHERAEGIFGFRNGDSPYQAYLACCIQLRTWRERAGEVKGNGSGNGEAAGAVTVDHSTGVTSVEGVRPTAASYQLSKHHPNMQYQHSPFDLLTYHHRHDQSPAIPSQQPAG